MKKFILPLLLFGFSTIATAQKDLFGRISSAITGKSSSGDKQDDALTSGVTSLLSSLLGGSTLSADDVQGTWKYKGVDCVFKTENVLMKAGGEAAVTKVEGKINDALKKFGVNGEMLSFTFNADNTFTITVKDKSINGDYSLDLENKNITLSYLNGKATITPQIVKNGSTLSLLYDADKFFKFLTNISAVSNNATIASLGTLLKSYEGLLIGMELQK